MPFKKWSFLDVKLPTIFEILIQVDKTKRLDELPQYLDSFDPNFTSAKDNTLCSHCNIGHLKRQFPVRQQRFWWRCNHKDCQHRYSLLVDTVLSNMKFSLGNADSSNSI
jgi:hypothetical protein